MIYFRNYRPPHRIFGFHRVLVTFGLICVMANSATGASEVYDFLPRDLCIPAVRGLVIDRRAKAAAWSPEQFMKPEEIGGDQYHFIGHGFIEWGYKEKYLNNPVIQNPKKLLEFPKLSASLFKSGYDHMLAEGGSIADAGLILKVPTENIMATFPRDARTGILRADMKKKEINDIVRMLKYVGVQHTPKELLKAQKWHKTFWNEVVLEPVTKSGSKIEVQGIFIRTQDTMLQRDPKSHPLYDQLLKMSKKYSLPIRVIQD